MEIVFAFIIVVSIFGIGFCVGHTYQLKQNLAELAELQEGLDQLNRMSAECDAAADICIKSLERDNNELRRQLAEYRKKEESK